MSVARTVVCDSCDLAIQPHEERFSMTIDRHPPRKPNAKRPTTRRGRGARFRELQCTEIDLCGTCAHGAAILPLAKLFADTLGKAGDW